MFSDRFNKCLPFVFQQEGWKSDDVGDPGGLTIWGICARDYPSQVSQMEGMPQEQAKEIAANIYWHDFWLKVGADDYTDSKNSLLVFDTAVNCGVNVVQNIIKDIGQDFSPETFLLSRVQYYAKISTGNPKLRVFFLGWVNRVLDLWQYQIN